MRLILRASLRKVLAQRSLSRHVFVPLRKTCFVSTGRFLKDAWALVTNCFCYWNCSHTHDAPIINNVRFMLRGSMFNVLAQRSHKAVNGDSCTAEHTGAARCHACDISQTLRMVARRCVALETKTQHMLWELLLKVSDK